MRLSRANARDASEPGIVATLRRAGASVELTEKPLDALVGYLGITTLAEFKLPRGPRGGESHSRMTPAQQAFLGAWRGSHWVLRTPEDGLAMLAELRRQSEAIRGRVKRDPTGAS